MQCNKGDEINEIIISASAKTKVSRIHFLGAINVHGAYGIFLFILETDM